MDSRGFAQWMTSWTKSSHDLSVAYCQSVITILRFLKLFVTFVLEIIVIWMQQNRKMIVAMTEATLLQTFLHCIHAKTAPTTEYLIKMFVLHIY